MVVQQEGAPHQVEEQEEYPAELEEKKVSCVVHESMQGKRREDDSRCQSKRAQWKGPDQDQEEPREHHGNARGLPDGKL